MWESGSLQVTERPELCLFDNTGTSIIIKISRYTVFEADTIFNCLLSLIFYCSDNTLFAWNKRYILSPTQFSFREFRIIIRREFSSNWNNIDIDINMKLIMIFYSRSINPEVSAISRIQNLSALILIYMVGVKQLTQVKYLSDLWSWLQFTKE
jgi:hypothetical protein